MEKAIHKEEKLLIILESSTPGGEIKQISHHLWTETATLVNIGFLDSILSDSVVYKVYIY